jgi:ribulose-5-phosphate 4-epimerase/fuculose-1-phosphate aldolase
MYQFEPAKQQIVAICRTLVDRGYLKATEGNISVRISDPPAFAITPSNYDYLKMMPEDICVLDYEMNALAGERKPSIESSMHAAVYQQRPDVQAIIHTHQPYASALALINAPIPALFDEQVRFLGRSVEIIPYAPSGTSFLKGNVKKKITSGNNAYILQNHGVLVLGGDPERAIHNMALLEKCALTYLLALCTEKKISKIPLPVREIAFAKLRADEKEFSRITGHETRDA